MTAFRVPRGWVEPDWDAIPPGFARHVHHGELVEYCTNFRKRVDYIKLNKPRGEVRRRLYLLGPIPSELVPKPLIALQAEYADARAEYNAARARFGAARARFGDARVRFGDACARYDWTALHAATCVPNCPWDGKSIFGSKP